MSEEIQANPNGDEIQREARALWQTTYERERFGENATIDESVRRCNKVRDEYIRMAYRPTPKQKEE